MEHDSPSVRKVSHRQWQLLENFSYNHITVPKGFKTDGASVPRVFWRFFSPAGALFEAAIIHDHLYVTGKGTKHEADTLFYQMAIHYRVHKIPAKLAYYAVKYF